MTFAEYFNALYPYLSDGETPVVFYDGMIGHFIYQEAQETCHLLTCKPDTKKRYFRETNPNKIKPEYANYAYSKHDEQKYRIWLKERMYQQDTFDKIGEWLSQNGVIYNDICTACDELLESIFFTIAFPNSSDVQLPKDTPDGKTPSLQLTEKDKMLLRDFHIDFDGILEKCIEGSQAEVWVAGRVSTQIDALYESKWKDLLSEFECVSLQSNILSTIATLKEFCNSLNPDNEFISTTPIRRLRMKLRNDYMKIHPDKYAGVFPYEAFIDDWNDGEDFLEM